MTRTPDILLGLFTFSISMFGIAWFVCIGTLVLALICAPVWLSEMLLAMAVR